MPDPRLQRTSRELFLAVLTGGAANLETWVIDRMTSVVEEEDAPAGKRLFAEGEPPESIFFIRDGRLRLERDGTTPWVFEGRTAIGVFDALLDRPHARTAIAETDLHLLKLRVDYWLELLEDSFGLARAALRNSVITVAGLEARRWATQDAPHGTVVARVPSVLGTLAFRRAARRSCRCHDDTGRRNPGPRGARGHDGGGDVRAGRDRSSSAASRAARRCSSCRMKPKATGWTRGCALGVVFGPGSVVGGVRPASAEPMLAWEARVRPRARPCAR